MVSSSSIFYNEEAPKMKETEGTVSKASEGTATTASTDRLETANATWEKGGKEHACKICVELGKTSQSTIHATKDGFTLPHNRNNNPDSDTNKYAYNQTRSSNTIKSCSYKYNIICLEQSQIS